MKKTILFALICGLMGSVNASDSKSDSKPEKTNVKKGTTEIRSVNTSDITPSERSIAKFVLKESRKTRENLKSGVYSAYGDRRSFSVKHSVDEIDSVELSCAFDYTNHLFRFRRKEPSWSPNILDKQGKRKLTGGTYIETPNSILHNSIGRDVVSVISQKRRSMFQVHPFDIRLVGFVNMHELRAWDEKQRFGSFYDRMFNNNTGFLILKNVTGVSSKDDPIFMLEWSIAGGRAVRRIWYDSSKGYSPIRLETRYIISRIGNKLKMSEPACLSTVQWNQIGGSWVPIEYSVEYKEYRKVLNGSVEFVSVPHTIQSYNLNFEWSNVNKKVSAQLFTHESIEKEFGREMYLIDSRLKGNAKILKTPK